MTLAPMTPKPTPPAGVKQEGSPEGAASAAGQPEPPRLAKGTRHDVTEPPARPPGLHDDLASLAHDLKNPLSVILLESRVLEQRLGRGSPAMQRGLERIALNATYVERLVAGLLDLVSSDEGRLEIRREPIDLTLLLRETIERSVASADRHRVQIDIRETLAITGDPLRLERVVANLVDNALKYAPRASSVTLRLDERAGCACVSVIDTGPGMTAAQVESCFERFRRGPSDREGHGLGLYICRKIIEAHRGRIGVQSTPGRGSRFYFLLPLA